MIKTLKLCILRLRLGREAESLVKAAIYETVFVRGYEVNLATKCIFRPLNREPMGRIYLPLLEDGVADMGPLWDFVRDTHGHQVRRYLALKRLLRRLGDRMAYAG